MAGDSIFLVGLRGSGKSALGRVLGERLGLPFLDTDEAVATEAGGSIAEILATEGEARLRGLEGRVIEALSDSPHVVALGADAVLSEANVRRVRQLGMVVHLHVSPSLALRRLGREAWRPLLGGAVDPLSRLRNMARQRLPFYRAAADYVVNTAGRSLAAIGDEVETLWGRWRQQRAVTVGAPSREYQVLIRDGLLRGVGDFFRSRDLPGRLFVIADRRVLRLWGGDLLEGLRRCEIEHQVCPVPPGERSKTLRQAGLIFDWLAANGARRDDTVLALGGGVVGDLAAFVASTYARGVRLLQVPTTLIAQVDSAIGGKTGVDLPAGKNLVGTFYQPHAVLADPLLLRTLPEREFRAGLAEVVKYGAISDPSLLDSLEGRPRVLLNGDSGALADLVQRCCEIKAVFVAADETEQKGVREGLNFGHTFAHAIETVTGFRRFRHGEAVALGMVAATHLSVECGTASWADLERLEAILVALRLPTRMPDLEPQATLSAMRLDKKAREGGSRFVVLDGGLGKWKVLSNPPEEAVAAALVHLATAP